MRGSQTSVQVLWDEPEDHGSTITEYLWSWKPGIFWDSESSVASTDFVHSSSPAYQDNEYRVRARNGAGLGPYGYYTVPREEFRSKPVADFADSTGFGVLTAPNPFNAQTRIHLALPEDLEVTLSVHSVTGQTVARLYDHTPLEARPAHPRVARRGRSRPPGRIRHLPGPGHRRRPGPCRQAGPDPIEADSGPDGRRAGLLVLPAVYAPWGGR